MATNSKVPTNTQAARHDGGAPLSAQELVVRIKTHIAKGNLAAEKSEQHYVSAGQYLKSLKEQHAGSWAEWEELLKAKIGIGKSRASELMQIADGRKAVEDVRIATADRARKNRKNRRGSFSVSNGEKATKTAQAAAAAQTMPGAIGPLLPDPPADDIWASLDIPPALDRRPKANGASAPAESTERVNADLSARVREAERKVIALESEIEELKLENKHLKRENAELRQGLNPGSADADDAQVEKLRAALPAIDKKLN